MYDAPPVQLLDEIGENSIDERTLPLHAVIRCGLSGLIDRHFEDGQRFWSESVLAERLNISRVTVRRALQDLSADGTLRRFRAKGTFVRKAIAPRTAKVVASSMALCSVGVFVPKYSSAFYTDLLDALSRRCDEYSLAMHVYHTHVGEKAMQAIAQLQFPPEKEGLILLSTAPDLTRELHTDLQCAGYASVTVDVMIQDYPAAYVGTNNDMGIRLGLRHLLELGHRRITMIVNEPEELKVAQARRDAFLSVAREQGIKEMHVVTAGLSLWGDAYSAAFTCLEKVWSDPHGPRPTALFCTSDTGAWATLKWLAERKVRVPEDVSVIGFDDDRPSRYTRPALTTVAHPFDDIARRAVSLLVSRGNSHDHLPPTLIVRASTGPPRYMTANTPVADDLCELIGRL